MKPRDQLRAEQRQVLRAAVATAASVAAPDLHDSDVDAVLVTARATKGIPLRELGEHLTDHPDALTAGDPRCPAVVVRLTHVLHDAGHTSVIRPGCSGCGKITRYMDRLGPDGRVCQMCAARANLATCARCGRRDTRIAARRTEGGICYSCYRTDSEVVEDCGGCGRSRMPVTRRADGTPLCLACWTPPSHRCDLCRRNAPVARR